MANGIHKGYMAAGPNFLAVKLGKIFTRIDKGNDEDRVLHNDALADVLKIIEGKEERFFKGLAQSMFSGKKETKKGFLRRMAARILNVGQ